MGKARRRSPRLWPLATLASVLWLTWALSAQFPVTFHPGEHWYFTFQRGCVGVWLWSPAERASIGVFDTLNIKVARDAAMAFRPFLWCDAWGFGAGGPISLVAAIATVAAIRRYAVTAVRDAPPATRRTRRWVVAAASLLGATLLGVIATAGHRTQQLLNWGRTSITIENAAVVIGRPEPAPTTATMIVGGGPFGGAPTVLVETRQGRYGIDLLPDWHTTATSWRLALPLWPAVILLIWLTWRNLSSAAYRGTGLCPACGYSLVGLAVDSACPECGTVGVAKHVGN